MKRTRWVFFFLCTTLFASSLWAQSTQPVSEPSSLQHLSEEQRKEKARTLFEEGEVLYNVMEYENALQKYKDAYFLSKRAGFLFNMGQCYRQLGRHEEALKIFQTYLNEEPQSDLRPDVEQFIRDLTLVIETKQQEVIVPDSLPGNGVEPSTSFTKTPIPIKPANTIPSGSLVLYSGASALGASALLTGTLAIFASASAKKTSRNSNSDSFDEAIIEAEQKRARAKSLALTSDILLGAALLSGGLGYFLHRKSKEVQVSLSPGGISIVLRY